MIELQNISFTYPKKKKHALRDISFKVGDGEIYTLLGPNGAGKTTLIRIISGLIIPQNGFVSVCGFDNSRSEYEARRKLGLVLGDERTFYFRLSGAQNLEFFGGLLGIPFQECRKRVAEVLEMVGLQDDAKVQYMRFSTGMKKRLSLARALLHDPDVYLLDEPNSGVDPQSARQIRNIIFDMKKAGKTILLTTHDMDEAEKMSDTIGFLKEGTIVKSGNIDVFKGLVNKKKFEVVFENTFSSEDIAILKQLVNAIKSSTVCESVQFRDGTLEVNFNGSFDMNRALTLISARNLPVRKVNTIEASLEDVFIKLSE